MNLKTCSALLFWITLLSQGSPRSEAIKTQSQSIHAEIPEDPVLLQVIKPLAEEIRASFDQPLVKAPKGLFRGSASEENLLGYWVTDVMRERSQALLGESVKFAITNRGGLRANLRAGQLKVGDIYEVMPFENELVIVELTGAEIKQIILETLARRGGEPCSGVSVKVEGTPESPQVTVTWNDGSAIKASETVKVATTDYLYDGGDSIPTLKKGRKPFTTGLTLRQVLLDTCQDLDRADKVLSPPPGGRRGSRSR